VARHFAANCGCGLGKHDHQSGRAADPAAPRRPADPRAQRGGTTDRLHRLASVGIEGLLPLVVENVSPLLLPVAIFNVLCGLLLIVSRNTAVMQVIGYMTMENGIYVFGWAFAVEEPFLVEMGVLLDVVAAVFVMGIIMHHLSREFDTIETGELSSLKD
jgi:hypothetical protein